MIPTTANFDARRNAQHQEAVFVLSMPSLGLMYTTRQSQPGLSPTTTFMKAPSGLTQQIQDLQGSATIGTLEITIVDVNRQLLPRFANTVWYGAQAILQLGFNGLTYPTDYVTLFSGIIQSVAPTSDHTGWIFTIQDANRILKSIVYQYGDNGVTPTSKTNPKTLDGNPLTLALDFLENQVGFPLSQIDTAPILALQNGRFACTRMVFSLTKSPDALTFFEQELLRPSGLFHFARYDGRISIGDMLSPPAPVTTAFGFTDSNIVGIPAFAQKTIYNWVEFQLDYDGSNYLDTEDFLDSDSINKFGLTAKLSIQSQGLRTNFQGASRAGIAARRIFARYANGPAGMITLKHPSLQACIVEVGDYVTVTHRLLEDLDTGTLGVTNRIYQVMQVQPNYAAGTITFSLIDVNSMASTAGYQYAPDSIPAYTAATAAEQAQYIFMANASSQQSNGAVAHPVF